MKTLKLVKAIKSVDPVHYGVFAAGLLVGTAGIKLLSSADAKGVYTKCLAAGLRAKDSVMKTVTKVQKSADDILAEAKQINKNKTTAEEENTIADEAVADVEVEVADADVAEEAEDAE